MNKDILSMEISTFIFMRYGFGPSKTITDEYAEKVIEQAAEIGFTLQ